MIEVKEKPCLGMGIAKGYGCGHKTKHRIYGLGKMCCYPNWLLTSDNGKVKMAKSLNFAKIKTKREQKQKDKDPCRETNIYHRVVKSVS